MLLLLFPALCVLTVLTDVVLDAFLAVFLVLSVLAVFSCSLCSDGDERFTKETSRLRGLRKQI